MKKADLEHEDEAFGTKRKKGRKAASFFLFVIIVIAAAILLLWVIRRQQLREDMEQLLAGVIVDIDNGRYTAALNDAVQAWDLAERLRDNEYISEINARIRLIEEIIHADELFENESYQSAMDAYMLALRYAVETGNIATGYLAKMIATTERYIDFYDLIQDAETLVEHINYEEALSLYQQAVTVAATLSFADGKELAAAGIADVKERIELAKRSEAAQFILQGDWSLQNGFLAEAIVFFERALEIFRELDDSQGISLVSFRIGTAQSSLADSELQVEQEAQDGQQSNLDANPDATQEEAESNYEYNQRLIFDMRALIDDQYKRPANQVRMGSAGGRNEGWYNGCGWVSTYNALILLDDPCHPADIVRYFESSGGTVFGGVFGTYPHAIERYLKYLGYKVDHALFPRIPANIDDIIKASRVCIIAYAHTSAAHYIAVEYRQEDGRFIVYNDNLARNRSVSLGLDEVSSKGAVIDSVSAFINNTPEILFAFSLIRVSSRNQ